MLVASTSVCVAKKKTAGMKKVHLFGFCSAFNDSVAYLTDVQTLDSTYVLSSGFLAERALYSLQLYGYANEKRGMANPTAAIFFDLKPQKLAKKYQKVKKLYQSDPNVKLILLTDDDFMFIPEEHEEQIVMEVAESAANAASQAGNAKKNKKTKKSKK